MKGSLSSSLVAALKAWGLGPDQLLGSVESGLINQTYKVQMGAKVRILQRLHPVFSPLIHHNIRAVSEALLAQGIQSPQLVPHLGHEDTFTDPDARTWRMLEYIEGSTLTALESPDQAEQAAAFLARWHGALATLEHRFVGQRAGVHDTQAHKKALQAAQDEHADHRLHADVRALASELTELLSDLPALPPLRFAVAHGDPKISNLRFCPDKHRARAWIDLDTVGPMLAAHELGDALRSWCNRAREDAAQCCVDLQLHRAAVGGYLSASTHAAQDTEQLHQALVWGPCWISAELSMRFAADALRESYFGYDSTRYPAAGEHNLARATAQLALAKDFRATASARREQIERA